MNLLIIVLIAALICSEAICEEEMNCEQLDSLDEDVFSKALDVLTDVWKTKVSNFFFFENISKRNLVN